VGPRAVAPVRLPEPTTRAVAELARSRHTTVSTVLQAAFARLLMSLTGRRDVAFGTVVSGRPAEVPGADAIVGLLINTVPVRATITEVTTTADLLDQLHDARNRALEHEHLGLADIHRVTGQKRLFDTVFVYENYPTDTAALSGADGLTVTGLTSRDHYHYPLTIQAVPGDALDLRVQYREDVFDAAAIQALVERLRRLLEAMTADPERPLWAMDPLEAPDRAPATGYHRNGEGRRPPAGPLERLLADVYAQVLGVDHVGADESFFDLGGDSLSAMRAVAAINTALDADLAVTALLEAPSVSGLSRRLGERV
jgi:non-ribosomal peptide synthetase component F